MRQDFSVTDSERLSSGILSTDRVSGLTHNLYRYPARFSPNFVRAAILEFSEPRDLIFDPFVGGGTTLVEASALGRDSVGTDISSLATFISTVKTTVYDASEIANVRKWLEVLLPCLTMATNAPPVEDWVKENYQRNLHTKDTWRTRKLLEISVDALSLLRSEKEQRLARCILLKTGQWALDCRTEIPSLSLFQRQIADNASEILAAAEVYASVITAQAEEPEVRCIHTSVAAIDNWKSAFNGRVPKLIVTSPPYPGLHVLYHRWQVKGRRETAAPFWLAGTLDGDGASFYTFGDRKRSGLESYFSNAAAAFSAVNSVCDEQTILVQMIAFSEPELQLSAYLNVMNNAGFVELSAENMNRDKDGRLWRSVPGRKWYASQMGSTGGSREVVLFHKKRYRK